MIIFSASIISGLQGATGCPSGKCSNQQHTNSPPASSVNQLLWMASGKWLQLRLAIIVSAPAQMPDSIQYEHWPTCNTPTRPTCSIATHTSPATKTSAQTDIVLNSVETRVWVSGILVPTLWHSCHDGPAGTALSQKAETTYSRWKIVTQQRSGCYLDQGVNIIIVRIGSCNSRTSNCLTTNA